VEEMTVDLNQMIEVHLAREDDFLKIKETLTRIGIASKKDRKLFQSCHILHKKGRYYIVHFKELFALDGKASDFYSNQEDIARRNTIANLLEQWNLLVLVDGTKSADPVSDLSKIKILPFKEKNEWELVSKYTIGKRAEG
jgi:hypothetical protein